MNNRKFNVVLNAVNLAVPTDAAWHPMSANVTQDFMALFAIKVTSS
jgi:hypothetical protein